MRGRVAIYVAGAMSLVLLIASLAVLDAERGAQNATIKTFGDAAWWAFTTVTTVGYGDRYPITGQGPVHRRWAHARRHRPARHRDRVSRVMADR